MAKNVQPKADETPTGTTDKVTRKKVLLGYSKRRSNYTVDETTGKRTKSGTTNVQTGNWDLFLPTKVTDWFDIPTSNAVKPVNNTPRWTSVKQHNYTTFGDIDDTTGTERTRREFKRLISESSDAKKRRTIQVPVGDGRVTAKGKPRMITIPFPPFFDVTMIAQALGQMFNATAKAERKPVFFYMGESGKSYPIPYNTGDAPFTGADSGAWIAATYSAPTNDQPGDAISSGGGTLGLGGDRTTA